MSAFYKMDPSAWDVGTTSLSLEEEAAYLRIINAIHKHDQPVPDNDRVLAGMFRCSTRKARALVEALVAAGKIEIEGGRITNERAVSDLVRRGFVSNSRAESGAKGGRTRAENAAKSLKDKNTDQAIASSRIEENREEKEEPIGSSKKSDHGFAEFWAVYPRKVGKAAAERAFLKALRKAGHAEIVDGARRYAASRAGSDPQYTAHPATWLNAGRWDDEPQAVPPSRQSSVDARADRWRRMGRSAA